MEHVNHLKKVRRRRAQPSCLAAAPAASVSKHPLVAGSDCLPNEDINLYKEMAEVDK